MTIYGYLCIKSKGHKISEVQQRLQGITCGSKNTSCPDQFAQLLSALENK